MLNLFRNFIFTKNIHLMVLEKQLHHLDELVAKGKLLEATDAFYTESASERRHTATAFWADVDTYALGKMS